MMKTLQAFVLSQENTDLNLFQSAVAKYQGMHFDYETDFEKAIEAVSSKKYDLLIMDNAIDQQELKKLNKLIDLLHPEMATLALHFNDAEFIKFKMASISNKWFDAQSDAKMQFWDNPNNN